MLLPHYLKTSQAVKLVTIAGMYSISGSNEDNKKGKMRCQTKNANNVMDDKTG
jgi:hypothetical protein